ncbi:MAG: glycosyltransferase [Reyranella sp.]|nr:MAG: glycosyltransferase [Reyranella sp.]
MLGAVLAGAGLILCFYIGVLVLADLYLIAIHLRGSHRRPLREPAEHSQIDAIRGKEPVVCVQLPIFNEAKIVGAAIDSLCALDWPRDRLEIMVLDDSTDETSSIVAQKVEEWRHKGFAISHVVRPNRDSFKAGALAAGQQQSEAQYFAIFDADYRPLPSFLRQTMAALLADPGLAFVQARLGYRNRERNALTRAQAMELDTLMGFEQAARNWAGMPMPFNGTCGVWRREAIEQAGGWRGDSVAEDQDLSFRSFALGWRCRLLLDVSAAGELPDNFEALALQRQRWSTGTAQVFRKLPWTLLHSMRWPQATAFTFLTLFYSSAAVVLVAILAIAAVCWLVAPEWALIVALGWVATVALLVVLRTIGAALAARQLGRPINLAFVGDVVAQWLMQLVLLPTAGKALIAGYLVRAIPFARTPKKGH